MNLTPNAQFFLDKIPGVDIPLDVIGCFKGNLPWAGMIAPDIILGIERLANQIDIIKQEFQKEYGWNELNENNTLDYLLENCNVWLATSQDEGKTKVKITNLFSGEEEYVLIPPPEYEFKKIPTNEFEPDKKLKDIKIKIDSLGVYFRVYGFIVIYIDKIFKYYQAGLLFQKVLLHEFIHALLDITPRYKDSNNVYNSYVQKELDEEKIDNTLVLFCYDDWAHCGVDVLTPLKEFIKCQPDPYDKAIDAHVEGFDSLKHEIKDLFNRKMNYFDSQKRSISCNLNTTPGSKYTIDTYIEPEETEEEKIERIKRNLKAVVEDIVYDNQILVVKCEKPIFQPEIYQFKSSFRSLDFEFLILERYCLALSCNYNQITIITISDGINKLIISLRPTNYIDYQVLFECHNNFENFKNIIKNLDLIGILNRIDSNIYLDDFDKSIENVLNIDDNLLSIIAQSKRISIIREERCPINK